MAVAGKVAPIPKGEWAVGTNYNKIDIVTHNKDAYIALQANIGQEPVRTGSAYWMLLVEAPGDNGYFTGTCTTGAATAAKLVTVSDPIALRAGVAIMVKFSYTNTAASPTLNVGSTGAKSIYYEDSAVTTEDLWTAGEADVYEVYVYDGTYWVWLGHSLNSGGVSEDIVAPIETSPSGHRYEADAQLFYNDVLYVVTDDIEIGDALVVGTNIEAADDLVTQIANAGKGSWIDKTWAEYEALPQADREDPEKYYSVEDMPSSYYGPEGMIAPVEDEATASQPYKEGDQLVYQDRLYKALSAIQLDEALTPGTNIGLADSIVEQIKSLPIKTEITDCNTAFYDNRVRAYTTTATAGNRPTSDGLVYDIIELSKSDGNGLQIALQGNSAIWARSRTQSGATWVWQDWKQIYGYSTDNVTWIKTPSAESAVTLEKNRRIATITGSFYFTTASPPGTELMSIPSKYHAAGHNTAVIPLLVNNGDTGLLIFSTDNKIKVSPFSTETLPANQWMHISGSWVTAS